MGFDSNQPIGQAVIYDKNGNPVHFGPSVPQDPTLFIVKLLKDGASSPDMDIDGTTPKTFTFGADATKDLFLIDLQLMIVASSLVFGMGKFAGLAELTNGVKVEVTVNNGTTSVLGTLQKNEDLMFFSTAGGWDLVIANKDIIRSVFSFGGAMKLAAGTADEVKITVQDNLSIGINFFQAQLRMTKAE